MRKPLRQRRGTAGTQRRGLGRLAALALLVAGAGFAEIRKFEVAQPGTRNFGVWRLTHDAAVRDEGNYHNIQCWSPNGRYTCYTHWDGANGPGGKASAEIHVVDLSTGEDRRVDTGISPRWANGRNWLFYCHWTGDGTHPYETGTRVMRYDADAGEKVLITHGMEGPGSLDATDAWLYGVQRFRGRKPESVTVRVRNQPNSKLEALEGAPNKHGYVHVNPRHPVIMSRAKDPSDPVHGTNRAFFDLDGSNVRQGAVMAEMGHMSWSGDGAYLLIGNRQVCGRRWNEPYPSDLHVLSWGRVGDVCPCGKSGRYICGGDLAIVDTRSGDQRAVVHSGSYRIYPMAGDNSTLMDIDPKGSPDGTKIHYHSTLDLENAVRAVITKFDPKAPQVIHVESTAGFPDSGDLACRWEALGYESKTATTFEGVTRQKYGTRLVPWLGGRKAPTLLPLSAFLLTEAEKARSKPDGAMVKAGVAQDNPLLYQRFTDCYVVVARLPDPPHLRLRDDVIELIPGENHWETRGYRLSRDGTPLKQELLAASERFELTAPGRLTATAVEWSGLESPPSLELEVEAPAAGLVLSEPPPDFSWTRQVWRVQDAEVSRDQAMAAPESVLELVHLHDGVIARETWRNGQRALRVDLNADGKPIRHREFRNGKLHKQVYRNPDGVLASEELFGDDGFKTEYISYYTRPGSEGRIYEHWRRQRGQLVKRVKRGKVVFE